MTHLAGILETTVSAAAVASAGALAYAVRVPSCSWLAPSVCRGADARPAIALTFDDGPSESTPQLLEILARYHAPATFFQCGANVRRLPSAASEVAAAGHEIGNHSDRHLLLALKSPGFIHRELSAAQESIEHATSVRPRYFRPPYGARWFGLRAAASWASGRDVERPCVRLENADRRCRLPLAPGRDRGRDSLLARWPSP